MGGALIVTLVSQKLGSMAKPLKLLATLKMHKAIYVYKRPTCPGSQLIINIVSIMVAMWGVDGGATS